MKTNEATRKKLSLNKESIDNLSTTETHALRGGWSTITVMTTRYTTREPDDEFPSQMSAYLNDSCD